MFDRPDEEASVADRTFADRYRTHFERWVHGRTPAWARPVLDPRVVVRQTFDDVQRDGGWAQPHDGPLLEHVRRVLYHNVLGCVRQAAAAIAREDEALTSVLPLRDQALADDLLRRYEAGLRRLPPAERQAIVARAEMALSWPDVAHVLKAPHPATARLTVSRALVHLAREMAHEPRG